MDSAGSTRHPLAVATIALAISLGCAAAVYGGTGHSPGNTAASAPSSLLTKLPQPQLPKFPVIYTYGKHRPPRPPTTNPPTTPRNKQQESQRPPQKPSKPLQKRPPKPTVDKRRDGRDPYQASANASVTTSPRPKLETTTQDRAIITVPLKSCPEGQRMSPDRICRPKFPDPEDDEPK
ncbi:uncharacterized protein LOC100575901 precursor [Acyrthosiphon pisum]|uniref:ACYPI41447 protein n=1 Tax=Acyrthosiphon pisum TaxID=7029 RepID=C4WX60_ACYPI|nr:uncharacterized protein LOC100575901 precursor [Acyrthosiphon pisum]BAH72480.1 ACYPI41447 [Acyrthosiphon pisum]|eukprot:NP_001233042.1 uncharacterized protein LOC100575901 precursor [Acyrthosiphon pisum]